MRKSIGSLVSKRSMSRPSGMGSITGTNGAVPVRARGGVAADRRADLWLWRPERLLCVRRVLTQCVGRRHCLRAGLEQPALVEYRWKESNGPIKNLVSSGGDDD